MNRRTVLKRLTLAATAIALMPSCIQDQKRVSIALNNLKITAQEEELLASLAETIIPANGQAGGREVGAHLFTLVMLDDCENRVTQEKFLKGMRAFDPYCKTIGGETFSNSSAEGKLALLKKIESNQNSLPEDLRAFYQFARRFVISGYQSSEYYLTKVRQYQLVPGPNFKGCIPVSKAIQAV